MLIYRYEYQYLALEDIIILRNKYGEIRSGWSILSVLLVLIAGQLLGGLLASNVDENDIVAKLGITLLYGLITIGGSLLLFKLLYRRPVSQMGFSRKGWLSGLLHGLVIGTVSISIVFILLLLTKQAEVLKFDMSKLFSLAVIVEFISVGCFMASEEIITRGYMMTALKTTRNKYAIVFLPLLIFTVLHFTTPGFTVLSIINTFLVGLLFAYMLIKSGKLWLSIGFHIAWNFVEGDILGMKVSGNLQASILSTKMGMSQILTGGNAGPEGGILTTCVLLLAFLYTWKFIKLPQHSSWTFASDLPFIR